MTEKDESLESNSQVNALLEEISRIDRERLALTPTLHSAQQELEERHRTFNRSRRNLELIERKMQDLLHKRQELADEINALIEQRALEAFKQQLPLIQQGLAERSQTLRLSNNPVALGVASMLEAIGKEPDFMQKALRVNGSDTSVVFNVKGEKVGTNDETCKVVMKKDGTYAVYYNPNSRLLKSTCVQPAIDRLPLDTHQKRRVSLEVSVSIIDNNPSVTTFVLMQGSNVGEIALSQDLIPFYERIGRVLTTGDIFANQGKALITRAKDNKTAK